MQIKPPTGIPHLPQIEKSQEVSSTAEPTTTASVPDEIEISKANPFQDAVQAAADQNEGTTAEENLTSEQQNLVSKFHPENEHLEDASFFLKDARSRDEDRKNSGLQFPGVHIKEQSPEQAKVKQEQEQAKTLLQDQNTIHDGSDKDFSDMAPGLHVNIRDQFNKAAGKQQQELTDMGVLTSITDRLKDDPTSKGPTQSPTYEKGMIADDADPPPDNSPKGPKLKDVVINFLEGLPWVFTSRGPILPPTPPDPETGKNMLDGFKAIFSSKSRTPESEAKKGGADLQSSSWEDSRVKLDPKTQRLMDFFKQQMQNMRGSTGGEKVHTVDTDTGMKVAGDGRSLLLKEGNLGMFGNPGEAPVSGGATGSTGHLGGTLAGGNIDYGPDSEKQGWTGITHQDDPGDISFGPQQPADKGGTSKSSDSSSDSTIDPSALYQFLEKLRNGDPALLQNFLEQLKKLE